MKTHTIKTPKAELLVVELPKEAFNEYSTYIKVDDETSICYRWNSDVNDLRVFKIKGSYTLLGKPDEISEEDAAGLIPKYYDHERTATQYLLSAIEMQVFWENPIPTPEIQGGYDEFGNFQGGWDDNWISEFEKAESRTFDRNRTLIFKKN